MKNTYYAIVNLSNKIKTDNPVKRIMKIHYLTSFTWANKHFENTKFTMTQKEKETQTLELWRVEEDEYGQFTITPVKSWVDAWAKWNAKVS